MQEEQGVVVVVLLLLQPQLQPLLLFHLPLLCVHWRTVVPRGDAVGEVLARLRPDGCVKRGDHQGR